MKLLLTSNGICNKSLAGTLTKMVGKQAEEVKIAFIPTAVNVDQGNKDWFIKQFTDLQKFGFERIDIVEIASEYVDWQAKLKGTDVIYSGGGNPYYLLEMMRRISFGDWLAKNIGQRVYVGGSAGAIVATPNIGVAKIKTYGSKNIPNLTNLSGLKFVNFEVAPHAPDWPSYMDVENYAKTTKNSIYAIDNESGIKIVDGKIEVISEGQWRLFVANDSK